MVEKKTTRKKAPKRAPSKKAAATNKAASKKVASKKVAKSVSSRKTQTTKKTTAKKATKKVASKKAAATNKQNKEATTIDTITVTQAGPIATPKINKMSQKQVAAKDSVKSPLQTANEKRMANDVPKLSQNQVSTLSLVRDVKEHRRFLHTMQRGIKQAFGDVRADLDMIFTSTLKRFQNLERSQDAKIIRTQENVEAAFKQLAKETNHRLNMMQHQIAKVPAVAAIERYITDARELAQQAREDASTAVLKEDYERDLNQIHDELNARDVRQIHIVELEDKIKNMKADVKESAALQKDFESLREEMITLQKDALTKVSFQKLESWIKDVEKEVHNLDAIHAKMKHLVTLKQADKIRDDLNTHKEAVDALRSDTKKIDAFDKDLDAFDTQLAEMRDLQKSQQEEIMAMTRMLEKVAVALNMMPVAPVKGKKKSSDPKDKTNFMAWLMEEE